jgi:hypothetical protein
VSKEELDKLEKVILQKRLDFYMRQHDRDVSMIRNLAGVIETILDSSRDVPAGIRRNAEVILLALAKADLEAKV